MKKIQCIPMLLIAALVLCSGISESFAQPNPCIAARANGSAEYNTEWGDPCGLFICVSEVIPDVWEDACDCHEDCYYIHIRNNTDPACTMGIGDIDRITIIFVNDSTSETICFGGSKRQWTEVWDAKYAGSSTNFPADSCIGWGIDMLKGVDTKPGVGGNDVQEVGNHWTAKVCGSQTFKVQVHYKTTPAPLPLFPNNITFGPFILNTDPCPEFGNDHGWD